MNEEINSPTIEELLQKIRPIVAAQQRAYYEANKDKLAEKKRAWNDLPLSEKRRIIEEKYA